MRPRPYDRIKELLQSTVPAWLQAGAFSGLCMSIVTHKQAEQVSELSKNKIIIVP
jgi:hypothetical protein